MNQRKLDVPSYWLNLYDVLSGSELGHFASDRSGARSSVYPIACAVCETETAGPRALGLGRCK